MKKIPSFTVTIYILISANALVEASLHHSEPVPGEEPGLLHHHAVVEEADEDEGNGELHDSVKGLEEEDGVESYWKLQQKGAYFQQVTHHYSDQKRTERLEHVSHQTQSDVLVMRHATQQRHFEYRTLLRCQS